MSTTQYTRRAEAYGSVAITWSNYKLEMEGVLSVKGAITTCNAMRELETEGVLSVQGTTTTSRTIKKKEEECAASGSLLGTQAHEAFARSRGWDVFRVLNDVPLSAEEISKASGVSKSTTAAWLGLLTEAGVAEKVSRRFRLAALEPDEMFARLDKVAQVRGTAGVGERRRAKYELERAEHTEALKAGMEEWLREGRQGERRPGSRKPRVHLLKELQRSRGQHDGDTEAVALVVATYPEDILDLDEEEDLAEMLLGRGSAS